MTVLRYDTLEALGFSSDRLPDPSGSELEMTPEVFRLVSTILQHVSDGRPVTLITSEDLLTSTQAAEALGISRPTLYRLLDDGVLPTVAVRTQRRVPAWAVTAYQLLREARISTEEFEDVVSEMRAAGVTDEDFETVATQPVPAEASAIADAALEHALSAAAQQ